jgi:hypothetical protein
MKRIGRREYIPASVLGRALGQRWQLACESHNIEFEKGLYFYCYRLNRTSNPALVRCLEREIAFSVLNNLLFRTNYFLFRTNFIESAFLERCFIARLHCFRLGNHNRIHTEKQHVCL